MFYPATAKRPAVEVSKAVIDNSTINNMAKQLQGIDPSKTPNSAYMKKTK